MYRIEIFDRSNKKIGRFLYNDTRAQRFFECICFLEDMINGSPRINSILQKLGLEDSSIPCTNKIISVTLKMLDTFLPKLLSTEQQARELSVIKDLSEQKNTPRYTVLNKFLDLLKTFNIPGVAKIEVIIDSTANQIKLNNIRFPYHLIPKEFKCMLTDEVMSTPTYDKKTPDTVMDTMVFEKRATENNFQLNKTDFVINENLKIKIEAFVKKAELIYALYPSSYLAMYAQYKEEITGDMTSEVFQILVEKLLQRLEKYFLQKTDNFKVQEYIASLKRHQNTELISYQTGLTFVASLKQDYYVDAILDISKKTPEEEKEIEAKLTSNKIPFIRGFFGAQQSIIIPHVNVEESVKDYISISK